MQAQQAHPPKPSEPIPKQVRKRKARKAKAQAQAEAPAIGEPTGGSEGRHVEEAEEEQDKEHGEDSEIGEPELSLAAKEARLRRLCEQKPSGKIKVPMEIHTAWKQGGVSREQLLQMLESSDWDKDSAVFFTDVVLQSF